MSRDPIDLEGGRKTAKVGGGRIRPLGIEDHVRRTIEEENGR